MAKRSVKSMVEEAERVIEAVSPADVSTMIDRDETVLVVDIRDIRELQREGKVPGAFHCPRGMLEFWIDPESPYHKSEFADPEKTYVFYCASAWRSALATKTAREMGLSNAKHIAGGFTAWRDEGLPVERLDRR